MNLPLPLALPAWTACFSALRLDRWMMGELDPTDAESIRLHLATCAGCSTAVAGMRGVREELRSLPLPPALAAPRVSWKPRAAWATVGLALAATLVLVLRPGPLTERSKGHALGLSMYVQHGGEVRRAGRGDAVAPGDAVRFAVSTPVVAYVAVLSLDPNGRAFVYFPDGAQAARVAAGSEVALPLGTRLDATRGEERLLGLFCNAPVSLEPLRRGLEESAGALPLPAGCQGVRWSFVKR
jgi:hypothetical protein